MAIYPYIYIHYNWNCTHEYPTIFDKHGTFHRLILLWRDHQRKLRPWRKSSGWKWLVTGSKCLGTITIHYSQRPRINFLLLESYQISIPLGFIKLNLHFQCYLVPNGPSHFRHVTHPEGRWESARWVSLGKCCLPWSQLGIFEPWILLIWRKYGDLSSKIGWFNGIEYDRTG